MLINYMPPIKPNNIVRPIRQAVDDRINLTSAPAVLSGSGKGLVFYLLTLYLFLDLVRPSFVWHFPKIISLVLLIAWITKSGKVSCIQVWGFAAFVSILGIDILVAENTYDAVWTTYGMCVLLLGICIPLITFTDTLEKLRYLVNVLLAIFFYIGLYAITHAGFGPAGSGGGQDENYVAAGMNLVIPLALFSFFAEKIKWRKAVFLFLIGVYLLAIVVGLSRGGFVGLVCGLGFSLMKSPNKGVAIVIVVLVFGFLGIIAGASYWAEMGTITDTSESTADMRLELWKIAVQEFLAYPLTGVGGDNYLWRMNEFQSPEQTDKFGRIVVAHVHSTYFQLLSEMGLAGCIVFAVIMLRTYRDYRGIDYLSERASAHIDGQNSGFLDETKWIQNYSRGLMGGLIGYMASVAFLSALYYSHIWILVSMICALHMITIQRFSGPALGWTEAS